MRFLITAIICFLSLVLATPLSVVPPRRASKRPAELKVPRLHRLGDLVWMGECTRNAPTPDGYCGERRLMPAIVVGFTENHTTYAVAHISTAARDPFRRGAPVTDFGPLERVGNWIDVGPVAEVTEPNVYTDLSDRSIRGGLYDKLVAHIRVGSVHLDHPYSRNDPTATQAYMPHGSFATNMLYKALADDRVIPSTPTDRSVRSALLSP